MFNLFLLQLLETEKHRKIFSWVYILEYEEFFWTYYLLYSLIWKDDTIGQMETCLLFICQASDCGAVSLFSGKQTTLATEQMCPGRSGPEDWRKVWPSAPAATRNDRAQPFCCEKDESLAPHSVMGLSHPPGRSPRGYSRGHISPFTVPCSLLGVSWMIRSSFLSLLGVLSSPGWVFFCSQKLFHNS